MQVVFYFNSHAFCICYSNNILYFLFYLLFYLPLQKTFSGMNISKEGIEVTKRFFEAIDILKAQKRMRGLLTFTKAHSINYWNINTVRNQPDVSVLKPEWITYLVLDYGISAEWVLTGRGGMFK